MKIYRTTTDDLAVIARDERPLALVPWDDLLALRDLVAAVPPEAANDEDYEQVNHSPWSASGSSFGIAITHDSSGEIGFFDPDEWKELSDILYVGDDLLLITEVADIAECSRQLVDQSIWRGELFAFQRPDLSRRQWRIPRRAVDEWR